MLIQCKQADIVVVLRQVLHKDKTTFEKAHTIGTTKPVLETVTDFNAIWIIHFNVISAFHLEHEGIIKCDELVSFFMSMNNGLPLKVI